MKEDILVNNPKVISASFILAHGAGAPMDSDWMNELVEYLTDLNILVIRFEFPYMRERRKFGKKRPPNKMEIMIESWESVLKTAPMDVPLIIGGKSMGGRVASEIINSASALGLVALGFPFHAPKSPMGSRLEALLRVQKPTLIIQGERDSMGSQKEIKKIQFPSQFQIKYLADGDHSFKPRVKSGHTQREHLKKSATWIKDFINDIS